MLRLKAGTSLTRRMQRQAAKVSVVNGHGVGAQGNEIRRQTPYLAPGLSMCGHEAGARQNRNTPYPTPSPTI